MREERPKAMQKLRRDPKKLETLELYMMLGGGKVSYSDDSSDAFLNEIRDGLSQGLGNISTVHGFRVQNLFESMVASMGTARLIKREDTGGAYVDQDAVRIPDFRVVTLKGANYLIEVKNYYQTDPRTPYRLSPAELEKLKNYAAMVGTPLKIAIYWVQWNLWTLNDPGDFDPKGRLNFGEALRLSEMVELGDYMIATEFPLQMILLIDKTEPRERVEDGFRFTIGGVEIRTAGRVIEDQMEKGIAFFFMLHGTWHEEEGPALALDDQGLPATITFTFAPLEPPDPASQPFYSVGYLSQLFSNYFNALTVDDGKVVDLGRDKVLALLASFIPENYRGQSLRLWRFLLQKGEGAQKGNAVS